MPHLHKLASQVAGCGWRRLLFVAFCMTMIVIGAVYLDRGAEADPRGRWKEEIGALRSAVVLAMIGFGVLASVSPWLVSRGRLLPLAPTKMVKTELGGRRWFWLGVAIFTVASGLLWSQRMNKSLWTDEVTTVRRCLVGRWKHNGEGRADCYDRVGRTPCTNTTRRTTTWRSVLLRACCTRRRAG